MKVYIVSDSEELTVIGGVRSSIAWASEQRAIECIQRTVRNLDLKYPKGEWEESDFRIVEVEVVLWE